MEDKNTNSKSTNKINQSGLSKITTQCSHCQAKFKTKSENERKKAKCPKCEQAFVIVPIMENSGGITQHQPHKQNSATTQQEECLRSHIDEMETFRNLIDPRRLEWIRLSVKEYPWEEDNQKDIILHAKENENPAVRMAAVCKCCGDEDTLWHVLEHDQNENVRLQAAKCLVAFEDHRGKLLESTSKECTDFIEQVELSIIAHDKGIKLSRARSADDADKILGQRGSGDRYRSWHCREGWYDMEIVNEKILRMHKWPWYLRTLPND